MPYVSDKQRRFFNSQRKQLEAQGVDVDEWNASSRGRKLPETAQQSLKGKKKAPEKRSAASSPPVRERIPTMPQLSKQAAQQKMAAFLQHLIQSVPAGTKAAQVQNGLRQVQKLQKLAQHFNQRKDLIQAVQLTYPEKTAAYRHQVVQGLLAGLRKSLQKQAATKTKGQNQKQALVGSVVGASKHPSAALSGGKPGGAGKPAIATTQTSTTPYPMSR